MEHNAAPVASPPIITKSDITRIKEYVTTAHALPITLSEVQQFLKGEENGIAGLEPYEIASTFAKIVSNANSWNDIELSMKKVAGSLNAFHADLTSFGNDIIDAVVTMPGYKNYLGTLERLSEEEIALLPPLQVGQEEKNRFPTIKDSIQFIARSIEQKRMSSTDIELRLRIFKKELNNEISVMISKKLKLADPHEVSAEISQLNAEIDAAQQLVDKKTKAYESNIYDKIFSFHPTLFVIERTKEVAKIIEVDPLIRRRNELTEQVRQKYILTGTLQTLHNRLSVIDTFINDAISSVALVETLWITISEYIDSSKNKVDGIHEFLTLRAFVTSLRAVLEDWQKVDANARALTRALD
ncbi:hypothetical protein PS874_02146 [Pseudomonas fluorescens]|uniref:Toxin n=1 Tax=Pseudomonas silesiensis TaxID=1853130 RepID=A0A191Z005_9PSED|nr:alpha-xenorhabdolysin family binary toxin subunit A [Pseudomonas silesiensis]ANJ58323.1 hypothetical protein PMA3_25365 [Pseudomonas silesiensis]VVO90384.1 hypothetical protein PS874_02146 [Pseudomonas fluorescens]